MPERRTWVACSVADLRAQPNPQAERVSQLLLFSPCRVEGEAPGWLWVVGPDGYKGWIRASHTLSGHLPTPVWKVSQPMVVAREAVTDQVLGRMALDTRFWGEMDGPRIWLTWPSGRAGWVPLDAARPAHWTGTAQDVVDLAGELIGVPYLWGGTSPFGFDCSGLVQRLYHFVFNRWLPRDSRDQRNYGEPVPDISQLRPGDLLFSPGHVGIWAGDGKLIHASAHAGQVVITALDPPEDRYGEGLRAQFLGGVRPISARGAPPLTGVEEGINCRSP